MFEQTNNEPQSISQIDETLGKLSLATKRYFDLIERATKAFSPILMQEIPTPTANTREEKAVVSGAKLVSDLNDEIARINLASDKLERLINRSVL